MASGGQGFEGNRIIERMLRNDIQGSSPEPSAPEPLPGGAIVALSVAAFCSSSSVRMADALLPHLAGEFHVSLAQSASAVTAFSVAYGLAQLVFGPVGDRFGKYLVIAWACAACAITAALCALAPGFEMLVLARFIAGATCAAVVPLSMAWLGDVVPYENRQPVLARFLIGQLLGVSAGVMVGGFAADHLGWRTPFWGVSAAFVVICFVLLRLSKRLPEAARATNRAPGHPIRRMVSEFGEVLSIAWARKLMATVFFEGVFLFGAFAFIATHLHQSFGLTLASAGAIVMLFGFGGVVFASLAGVLVRRLGEVRLALVGGSVVTASLIVIGCVPVWWVAMPACLIGGLGFYMLHNTLQTNATQMAPQRRGAAVSAFACCFFIGQAAGVAVAGVMATRFGTAPVIVVCACGVLGVALSFARARAERLRVGGQLAA